MIDKEDLNKLTDFIEANTRATEKAGIKFIDPRNFKSKLFNKQNHVIFGRRGAGKSTLINTLKKEYDRKYLFAYTNLDDFKDISFPNVLLHALTALFDQLKDEVRAEVKFYQIRKQLKKRRLFKQVNRVLRQFAKQIDTPDLFEEEIRQKQNTSTKAGINTKNTSFTGSISAEEANEQETKKSFTRNKLEKIRNSLTSFKKIILQLDKIINDKPIFFILDDFYFLSKAVQPYFLDFFHRLTKDTNLFLKVGTIKHRTQLYSQIGDQYIGTEINADIYEIDLDYTLDRYSDLKNFMRALLDETCKELEISIDIDELFSAGAFDQLCLASGGVPRDFLVLFNKCCDYYSNDRKISIPEVREVSISNSPNKLKSLKKDSSEESELLEEYLNYVKSFVFSQNRTNMFLMTIQDQEDFKELRQAIKELVDLRMFHLVDSNTSAAPSDGKRYSAYMIDISLYDNGRPRNFKERIPGVTDQKSRQDNIRSAPRIDPEKAISDVKTKLPNQQLILSYENN